MPPHGKGIPSPQHHLCLTRMYGWQSQLLVNEPAAWYDFITSCQGLQPGVTLATRKHIEWLLEGVESWNERRERDDFCPDLARVDIYEEFRKAGKIDNDGNLPLCRINLNRANLTKSRLCCDFTGGGADLRSSNLRFAKLADSQLANSMVRS